MPENAPKISICIPTYNRSDLLKKTLISVSKQTVRPHEVIVVDNCSEDDTEEVLKDFNWIKYYRNSYNLGMIENWNRCIELARGDFLTILHSDDLIAPVWHEEWQRLINLNSNKEIGVYFSAIFTIDSNENAKIIYRLFPNETLLKPKEAFHKMWSRNMCALSASGAAVYRKSVFDILGKFDPAYSTEADAAFALKVFNQFYIFYTPKLLFAYRVHPFQGFDLEKKIKDDEKKCAIVTRNLNIFKDFYNNELSREHKNPLFYKRLCHMYIAIAVFNFLAFKYVNAKKYYKLVKDVFPDIFNNISDSLLLISVILHYIKALIIDRLQAIPIRNVTKQWVV